MASSHGEILALVAIEVRQASYKLPNATRAWVSVPSLASGWYAWATLYRVFFSRGIYAVDDNELVSPAGFRAGGISD